MCLVALAIEMSAPSSSGRCASGVASVLSTTSKPPLACATSATAAMSTTFRDGFVGVSIQTSFDPCAASTIASVRLGTTRTSAPRASPCSAAIPRTAAKQSSGTTSTSPAPTAGISTAAAAAMPDAKTSASPPSSSPSAVSNAVHVGLPYRA